MFDKSAVFLRLQMKPITMSVSEDKSGLMDESLPERD